MKLITINHQQVHMTTMTSRRSLVQRSRSGRYGNRNLVNMMAPEPNLTYEGRSINKLQNGIILLIFKI